MSSLPVATLRRYANKIEAETVRMRLAAAGITARVTGEDAGTALGMGGAATSRLVHLEVSQDDYERADALLVEDERLVAEAGPWICGRCHEQNEAAFEICWSCSKPRREDDLRGRMSEQPEPEAPAPPQPPVVAELPRAIDHDDNPYRPVLVPSEKPTRPPRTPLEQPSEALREAVARCFRAAIIGVLVFPPLVSLYGVYLLAQLPGQAYRDPSLRRRLLIAWCINLVNIPAWTIFWLQM